MADNSPQKLRYEKERHSETHSLVEEISLQLETCKKDLDKAEKNRVVVMAYNTEAKALRERLSAKEQEVLDLTSELTGRERELRSKGKMREGSSHYETSCNSCSGFSILGLLNFIKESRLCRHNFAE